MKLLFKGNSFKSEAALSLQVEWSNWNAAEMKLISNYNDQI